jgi:hypothetical protein
LAFLVFVCLGSVMLGAHRPHVSVDVFLRDESSVWPETVSFSYKTSKAAFNALTDKLTQKVHR